MDLPYALMQLHEFFTYYSIHFIILSIYTEYIFFLKHVRMNWRHHVDFPPKYFVIFPIAKIRTVSIDLTL